MSIDLLHIGVEPTQVSKQAGIGEALEAVSEIATLSIVSAFHSHVTHDIFSFASFTLIQDMSHVLSH